MTNLGKIIIKLLLLSVGMIITGCGVSEFHMALESGDLDKARSMLEKNPQLVHDKERGSRVTPLHRMTLRNNVEMVKLLINAGANVNARDGSDETPLFWLSRRNRATEICKLLLANGADANAKENTGGNTVLHDAVKDTSKEVIELLINNNANVNARDKAGKTPLHEVVSVGRSGVAVFETLSGQVMVQRSMSFAKPNLQILELLIAKGADINSKDFDGNTPLKIAIRKGHKGAADLLFKRGFAQQLNRNNRELFLEIILENRQEISGYRAPEFEMKVVELFDRLEGFQTTEQFVREILKEKNIRLLPEKEQGKGTLVMNCILEPRPQSGFSVSFDDEGKTAVKPIISLIYQAKIGLRADIDTSIMWLEEFRKEHELDLEEVQIANEALIFLKLRDGVWRYFSFKESEVKEANQTFLMELTMHLDKVLPS